MKKLTCLVALWASISVPVLQAQEVEVSPVAVELMEVMRTSEAMRIGFDSMMPVIEEQARNWQLTPEQLEEFRQIHRDWFANDFDHEMIKNKIALQYDQIFSDEEMQDMIDFYSSKTGQKTLDTQAQLTNYGAQLGMKEGQKKQYLLQEEVRAFYQEHVDK